MTRICRIIADSPIFQNFILAVIIFTAVIMGLETSERLMRMYGSTFSALNISIQVIFVTEMTIRLTAYWPRLHMFFRSGWNVFDLTIVLFSLLPQTGAFATIARLARLLRVTRVISVNPELRLIVGTMLRSIPSLGHVSLLLGLLLYIYGILGFHAFHDVDPEHWGTLGKSLLTLFQILTLEGWVEIMNASGKPDLFTWVFFGSYVVVAVFVVINLFIAVVLNNLETAKAEQRLQADEKLPQAELLEQVRTLRDDLERLERTLRKQQGLS